MFEKVFAQSICNPVLPAILGGCDGGPDTTAGGAAGTSSLITTLASGMFLLGFMMAFIYLMVGSINWITAGGEKGKLEEARNRIINALIGIIILASMWAVMSLVAQFVGLDWEALPIPTINGLVGGSN